MKKLIPFLLLFFGTAHAIPVVKGDDTLIVSGVCLYASTDGVSRLETATSEDAGLEIRLKTSDGATELVYDATTEIEGITTIDTFEAPTASNVRFEIDPSTGCYQLMFAADSIDVGDYAVLTIEDSSTPAFMSFDATLVYFGTSADITTAATTALTNFDAATEANVDAAEAKIDIIDGVVDANATALAGELDIGSIKGCTITGDGGATPFDVSCP